MFKLHIFMKGETTVQAVLIIKLVIKLFFGQLLFPGAETSSHPLSTEEQDGAQKEHWLVCLLSRCTRNSLTYSFHGVCCSFQRANCKAECIHCTWLCSESRLKSCPPVSGFSFSFPLSAVSQHSLSTLASFSKQWGLVGGWGCVSICCPQMNATK